MDTHSQTAAPAVRAAVRVLLLDEAGRILLFCTESRAFGRSIWITPGGGLEAGETDEDGARRELWEETGLDAEIGPCVWHQRYEFTFQEQRHVQSERFYVVRCVSFEVSRANWTEEEHESLSEARWWSLDELARSDETLCR